MPKARLRPLFFTNASQLLTLGGLPAPRRGPEMSELGIIPNGSLLTARGIIQRIGGAKELEPQARALNAQVIDCRGRVVMPGFVDSHTHLLFAGSRVEDYEMRLRGRTYEEIAAAGGGIQSSARMLAKATPRELTAQASRFLAAMAAHGTTTVEVKTGYGLDVPNELKSLHALRSLRQTAPIEVVPTLLAAHSVPPEYKDRRGEYVEQVARRLIAIASRQKLAEFVDCFCDSIAFSLDDCRRVFEIAKRHKLALRIHAEQLTRTGAARLAIDFGAASADHLDQVTPRDIRALARSGVIATLVPGANFHLGLMRYPPARRLINAGAAVALATDFNPGTSPTLNMQFVLSLACDAMGMTPAEAITAATLNAACSLRRADRLGSLEPGKQADLVVMNVDDYRKIPYYFGVNHCAMTVKRGRIVYSRLPS